MLCHRRKVVAPRQTSFPNELGFSSEYNANTGSKLSNVMPFLQYRTNCSLYNRSCNQLLNDRIKPEKVKEQLK